MIFLFIREHSRPNLEAGVQGQWPEASGERRPRLRASGFASHNVGTQASRKRVADGRSTKDFHPRGDPDKLRWGKLRTQRVRAEGKCNSRFLTRLKCGRFGMTT